MNLKLTIEKLKELSQRGVRPKIWLRDDDFCTFSQNFEALIQVAKFGFPLVIAAVPWRFKLSTRDKFLISRMPESLKFCVHGFNHTNNGKVKGGASEFPAGRDRQEVLKELEFGFKIISEALPDRFLPIFVPPWNYIDSEFLPNLFEAGFKIISGSIDRWQPGDARLVLMNIDVDVLEYGADIFYPLKDIGHIDEELLAIFSKWESQEGRCLSVGILSHHTAMAAEDIKKYTAIIEKLAEYCDPFEQIGV